MRLLAHIGTNPTDGAGLSADLTSWCHHPTLLRIPISSLRLGLRPCSRLNCLSRCPISDNHARLSARTASGAARSRASHSSWPRDICRPACSEIRSRQSRASAQARACGPAPPCAQRVCCPRIAHAEHGSPFVRRAVQGTFQICLGTQPRYKAIGGGFRALVCACARAQACDHLVRAHQWPCSHWTRPSRQPRSRTPSDDQNTCAGSGLPGNAEVIPQ